VVTSSTKAEQGVDKDVLCGDDVGGTQQMEVDLPSMSNPFVSFKVLQSGTLANGELTCCAVTLFQNYSPRFEFAVPLAVSLPFICNFLLVSPTLSLSLSYSLTHTHTHSPSHTLPLSLPIKPRLPQIFTTKTQ